MSFRQLRRGRFRLLLDYYTAPTDAEASAVAEGPATIRAADAAAEHYLYAQARGLIPRDREAFAVLLLNTRHRAVALHVVSIGTGNSAPVGPVEVLRPAVALGARALVLMHHHPSGDPSPSAEDRRVTERMREAGELLGIDVLDHVVIGAGRFYAFADGRHHPLPVVQQAERRW